jgi:predicted outer membrane repeat protein
MKSINKIDLIIVSIILLAVIGHMNAQTVIKPGEISGVWTKKSSPYIIKGDLNISDGKTLVIQAGTKIMFDGPFKINVKGSLFALGTEKDSIVFTVPDATGIMDKLKYGWNGIRFDRRPVTWDTLKYKVSANEEYNKIFKEMIEKGKLDTTTKINLVMEIPDKVNDTLLADSLFNTKQGSRLTYCRFEYGTAAGKEQPYVFGGAIYIYRYSNLIINNCMFENNFAYAGGAIYCKEAAPVIANNIIRKCKTQSSGGAMVFIHSGPILINNKITDNASGYNGGAILFYESSPYVLNNTFLRNSAINSGGAIFCEKKWATFLETGIYSPTDKITFVRDESFAKEYLGAFPFKNTSSYYGRFINNIICENKSDFGGGISLMATKPEFTNITVNSNIADSAGGGIYCLLSAPQITNSIVNGNSRDQIYLNGESSPLIRYCNIESGFYGIEKDSSCNVTYEYINILNVPSKFSNPARDDYSLTKGSGCIDAGMPDTTSLSLPETDILGEPRIINKIIDLGALEYTGDKTKSKSTEESNSDDKENLTSNTDEMFTSVFPNPASGSFSIAIHNNIYEFITVRIFAQNGHTIYLNSFKAGKWFEEQINLEGTSYGTYIVVIYSDDVVLYKDEIIIQ